MNDLNDKNDLDWVKALGACSSAQVFEQLRQQVSKDVDIRQSYCSPNSEHRFVFVSRTVGWFSALVETSFFGANNAVAAVHFKLKNTSIQVDGTDFNQAPNFEATLTLNDEGECRAKINGQERTLWQLRKMALETLFFHVV